MGRRVLDLRAGTWTLTADRLRRSLPPEELEVAVVGGGPPLDHPHPDDSPPTTAPPQRQ